MVTADAEAGPSRPSPPRSRNISPASEGYADPTSGLEEEGGLEEDEGLGDGMESESESESDTIRGQSHGGGMRDTKGKGLATSYRPSSQADAQLRDPREQEKSSSSWADLDLSIIVACVSPIGNWLTGGDHIKNLFLIILLIFYLHQLIEIPWNLYQASRPRKPANDRSTKPSTERVAALAATELRRQELFLLFLTVVSPLLGATFLHHVLDALGGAESLSWFSTTLFVLATGIRPWSHLVTRLRERTHALHDAVHYPPSSSNAANSELVKVTRRLSALENEVKELRARAAHSTKLQDVCDDLSEAVGQLERDSNRSERKADAARLALSARIAALETGLVQLEQNRRLDIDALKAAQARALEPPKYLVLYRHARGYVAPFLAGVLRIPHAIWALGALEPDLDKQEKLNGGSHMYPMSILKNSKTNGNGHLPRGKPDNSPRLPTIPEAVASDASVDGDADADSDGTYVSDKEKPEASFSSGTRVPQLETQLRKRTRSRSRSRSRSFSGRAARKGGRQSFSRWAFEYARNIVLWPYRASARILIAVIPPIRRILPGYRLA